VCIGERERERMNERERESRSPYQVSPKERDCFIETTASNGMLALDSTSNSSKNLNNSNFFNETSSVACLSKGT
jgi:hypothetical protein